MLHEVNIPLEVAYLILEDQVITNQDSVFHFKVKQAIVFADLYKVCSLLVTLCEFSTCVHTR